MKISNTSMLQKHNTVVKTYRFCLTHLARLSSLTSELVAVPSLDRDLTKLLLKWLFLTGVALTGCGCAAIEKAVAEEAKKEVSERAKERWEWVAKGNSDRAYEYLSPASKASISVALYRKRTAGGKWWRSMNIEKVDCGQDTCRVTMALEYELAGLAGLKRTVEETWIKDAGTWWLVAGK